MSSSSSLSSVANKVFQDQVVKAIEEKAAAGGTYVVVEQRNVADGFYEGLTEKYGVLITKCKHVIVIEWS